MEHEEEYIRLKRATEIDVLRLDEEFMQLATNQMEAGEFCALYINRKDQAEAALKLAQSVAAHELRQMPNSAGKPRAEAQIASEIPLNPDVRAAQEEFHVAVYNVNLWKNLADSLRSKASATQEIAKLINAGYMTPTAHRRNEMRRDRADKGMMKQESNNGP